MKTLITLISSALLLMLGLTQGGLAQESTRTLSVPHLSVHISLDYNAVSQPMLIESFSTDDPNYHSVYCMSGYLDLRYVLRDSSGKVVPMNTEPWKIRGAGDIPYGTQTGHVPGAADPCKTVKVARAYRRLLLHVLYPQIPHGTYSLQVILAPRDRIDRATSVPIPLSI